MKAKLFAALPMVTTTKRLSSASRYDLTFVLFVCFVFSALVS